MVGAVSSHISVLEGNSETAAIVIGPALVADTDGGVFRGGSRVRVHDAAPASGAQVWTLDLIDGDM